MDGLTETIYFFRSPTTWVGGGVSGAVTAVPLLNENKCAQHILCSKTNWAAFFVSIMLSKSMG